MKKVIILCIIATIMYADVKSDIAVTVGYNKLDDPEYLYAHRSYNGVRAGIYSDNLGFQIGFEKPDQANCIGLQLKRYYANALLLTKLNNGLEPYGVATYGYETSSADGVYRPSQYFTGIGAGIKYVINQNFNIFLETRALKSLQTKDVALATTLGLGYIFDNSAISKPRESEMLILAPRTSVIEKKKSTLVRPLKIKKQTYPIAMSPEKTTMQNSALNEGYYIQMLAVTTSSAEPMLRKLRARGVTNVGIKKVYRSGEEFTLVVVGSYPTHADASRELKKLKVVSAGAFIKKF